MAQVQVLNGRDLSLTPVFTQYHLAHRFLEEGNIRPRSCIVAGEGDSWSVLTTMFTLTAVNSLPIVWNNTVVEMEEGGRKIWMEFVVIPVKVNGAWWVY